MIAVPFTNSSGDQDLVNLFKLDLVGDAQQRGFAQVNSSSSLLSPRRQFNCYSENSTPSVAWPVVALNLVYLASRMFIFLPSTHLFTNATQPTRKGELMALELYDLVNVALPKWYISMLESLDLEEYFPDWLVDILKAKTPGAFNKALAAVWDKEAEFVPTRLSSEMTAIAQVNAAAAAAAADLCRHSLSPQFLKGFAFDRSPRVLTFKFQFGDVHVLSLFFRKHPSSPSSP
jgi:hypothetical protein